jgi:hypothetical protein
MNTCNNCSNELTGKFCSNCGQPELIQRIDHHYIIHEIEHVLHFEKGILLTIKELLVRPGQSVRDFLSVNRSRLVKPIIFIIITSLIYTLINHFFHIEEGYISFTGTKESAIPGIFDWIQNHYGYSNIIMGVFIAFWLKLFFRKYNYNFFEILILLCFAMGMVMLIFSIFALLTGLTKLSLMEYGGFVGIVYCTWAIGQFFDKDKKSNYLKAFFAYMLGMISFSMLAILIGMLIDFFIKQY